MGLDVLIALTALALPGGIGLAMFDYTGHRPVRPMWVSIAIGILLSTMWYAMFQSIGWIRLASLVAFHEGSYSLKLDALLATHNLGIFVATCWGSAAGGTLLGRAAYSSPGQSVALRVFGKTLGGSSWAESAEPILSEWVVVNSRTGHSWMGILNRVSEHPQGYLRLSKPRVYDAEAGGWLPYNYEFLILAIADLESVIGLPVDDPTVADTSTGKTIIADISNNISTNPATTRGDSVDARPFNTGSNAHFRGGEQ